MKRMAGFAVVAVAGVFLVKMAFGLVGLVFSLLSSLLWFGLMAAAIYFVIRLVSPETAERIRSVFEQETRTETEAETEVT